MAAGRKTGGRVKGTPNKVTTAAREAFQSAFDEVGGIQKLAEWAGDNLTEFYKLYGRLIPIDLQGDLHHEGTLEITWRKPGES